MKRTAIFLVSCLLGSCLLVSCSINHDLSHPPTYSDLDHLNDATEGRSFHVMLDNGDTIAGHDLLARIDSTEWITDSANVPLHYVVSTDHVLHIDVKPANFGYRFTRGLIGGAIFGLSAGVGNALDSGRSFGKAMAGVGILTGVGLAVGAIWGMFDGMFSTASDAEDRYYIEMGPSEVERWVKNRRRTGYH